MNVGVSGRAVVNPTADASAPIVVGVADAPITEAAAPAHRLRRVVFEVGAWSATVSAVLAWSTTAETPTPTAALAGPPQDPEALIEAFRYRHELISAEECDAWLACRGLAYADLEAAMSRRARAEDPADAAEALVDRLLDEGFDDAARELARHAAWMGARDAAELAGTPDAGRFARWRHEVDHDLACSLDAATRRREAALLARAWTRLRGIVVEFDDAPTAHEARCCVEQDGADLVQLALEHGLAWRRFDERLRAFASATGALLEALPPGQIGLELASNGPLRLWQLELRHRPSPEDSEFADAVERSARRRLLDDRVARHVGWHWPLQAVAESG